jgi:hypothetical protein
MKSQAYFFDVLGKTSIHVGCWPASAKLPLIIYWDLIFKAWRRLFFAENNGVSKGHAQYYQRRSLWKWDYQNKINFYSRGLLPLLR